MSGSIPPGCDELPELLIRLRADGCSIAIDSHGPALATLADGVRPELVKINRSEAAALVGATPGASLIELADAVRQRTGGIAVVTDGAAGSLGIDSTGAYRVLPSAAIGRFAVGSGDCYLAALLVGLDSGLELPNALRRAAACATANSLVPGAASFDRDTVDQLTEQIEVNPC